MSRLFEWKGIAKRKSVSLSNKMGISHEELGHLIFGPTPFQPRRR